MRGFSLASPPFSTQALTGYELWRVRVERPGRRGQAALLGASSTCLCLQAACNGDFFWATCAGKVNEWVVLSNSIDDIDIK